jgi:tetratricopeptide (TPR) repeat protein
MFRNSKVIKYFVRLCLVLIIIGSQQASAYDIEKEREFDRIMAQGEKFHVQGNYTEAIKKYNEAIKVMPSFWGSYNLRGEAYLSLHQYKNALDEFTKAEKLDSINELVVYSNKTGALFFLGNHHESLEYANKALDAYDNLTLLDKGHAEAKVRLHKTYCHAAASSCLLGKREQALQFAEKGVQLYPNSWVSYATKGMVLARLGYAEDAIKSYEKAIEINPENITIRQEKNKLIGRSVVK